MKYNKTKMIILNGVIAALYAALTLVNPMSFGALQFRMSTMLLPFSVYIPYVKAGLVIGTFIGNINSSLGIIDMFFGTLVTTICVCVCQKIKNKYLQTLCYAIESGAIVSLELYYCFKIPIIYSFLSVGISGMIIYFLGVITMKYVSNIITRYTIQN